MSREKSEKVCITFRLSEEEHEKLKQYSSGLRSVHRRIYASVMQGKRTAATARERILGTIRHALRSTRSL